MVQPSQLVQALYIWAASPPAFDAIPNRAIDGLARYVRECTAPTDRLFATWFVPDLYFYAQRGFAGRIVALFGSHWSEERFQRRSVEALASHSVPIVITAQQRRTVLEDYPLIARTSMTIIRLREPRTSAMSTSGRAVIPYGRAPAGVPPRPTPRRRFRVFDDRVAVTSETAEPWVSSGSCSPHSSSCFILGGWAGSSAASRSSLSTASAASSSSRCWIASI